MLKDFTKESFDIFIQAGQSNAEGYGFGAIEDPYQVSSDVWYLNEDFTISQAAEKVTGNEIQTNFALSFARSYIGEGLLAEGRKILILRAAEGGTGFLDNRWNLTDDLYLRMLEMIRDALSLNPDNRLVALLWHQGELDSVCHGTYEAHYNHLMTLVKSVRAEFNVPDLPFIAGDFVQHWKLLNTELATPIANAIRAVCGDCGKSKFVESDGLLSNLQELQRNPLGWDDPIHFSRRAIYELGKRYFAAFKEITNL